MNKKVSLGICLSLIIVAVTATFAITMVYSKQIYNRIISNISQRSESNDAADEIYKLISSNYYGDLDDYNNNLDAYVAEGYVSGLNDSGCFYMTPAEYSDYVNELENGISGVGIETVYDTESGKLKVAYVYKDSPAESEGILVGDIITAINNETVTGKNYKVLVSYLFGTKLSTVNIEYERDEVTKSTDLMLGFSIPSVTSKMIDNIGYIRISRFYKNTASELDEILSQMKEESVENIIIDLRNTSAGTIKYSADALDVIVSNSAGILATAQGKDGKTKESYPSSAGDYSGFNYAVLINSATSGPAELFACDMRDIQYAVLIGTTTAGVGTLQEVFTLDDGSAISLTTALIIPKAGEKYVYDSVGVSPAEGGEVFLNGNDSMVLLLDEKDDNQLQKAVSVLNDQ